MYITHCCCGASAVKLFLKLVRTCSYTVKEGMFYCVDIVTGFKLGPKDGVGKFIRKDSYVRIARLLSIHAYRKAEASTTDKGGLFLKSTLTRVSSRVPRSTAATAAAVLLPSHQTPCTFMNMIFTVRAKQD